MESSQAAESDGHGFESILITSCHVSLGESLPLSELQGPCRAGMKPLFLGFYKS